LSIQATRQTGADNIVRWKVRTLQIPPSPLRAHHVLASIQTREYPQGRIILHHGPRRIAAFAPDGVQEPVEDAMAA
jgi:hypothetical protein